jgi:hypothetical protein
MTRESHEEREKKERKRSSRHMSRQTERREERNEDRRSKKERNPLSSKLERWLVAVFAFLCFSLLFSSYCYLSHINKPPFPLVTCCLLAQAQARKTGLN